MAQTVTVTGVDDAVVDGDVAYTIVTAAATSTDPTYTGVNAADVAVTNTDNDAAGITVTPTTGLTTTEAGGTATFTVVLDTQPTADVTIGLSSSDTTEGHGGPASLTFTTAELERGADGDGDRRRRRAGRRRRRLHDRDGAGDEHRPDYNGVNAADVTVTNTDDEVTSDLAVTKTNGVNAVTAGGATTYTIVVTNAGPGGVVGATVTDTAPAQRHLRHLDVRGIGRVDVSRLRDGQHRGKRGPRLPAARRRSPSRPRFHRRPAAR